MRFCFSGASLARVSSSGSRSSGESLLTSSSEDSLLAILSPDDSLFWKSISIQRSRIGGCPATCKRSSVQTANVTVRSINRPVDLRVRQTATSQFLVWLRTDLTVGCQISMLVSILRERIVRESKNCESLPGRRWMASAHSLKLNAQIAAQWLSVPGDNPVFCDYSALSCWAQADQHSASPAVLNKPMLGRTV